jgi:serine/threonine-protein kinase
MGTDDSPGDPTLLDPPASDQPTTLARPEPTVDVPLAGRYRLGELIAKGGMGEVFSARDEQVGRDVAIKRIRDAKPSSRRVARFLREASIQGRLEHPAIVPVHEIGRDVDGLPFFVMKKLSGAELSAIVARDDDEFMLQRVLRAFADVCLAIELAHVRGIVHRDLKPSNILLGDFGEVYVLDWGIAKVLGESDSELADLGATHLDGTAAGSQLGTPGYMSPEQIRGLLDIDGRADVYALGCVLFEILAGEPLHPRGKDGMNSSLATFDARPSRRAPRRDIAPELDAICVDATVSDRDARIATARELGARVQRFLDGDRDVATRREHAREHYRRAHTAFVSDEPDHSTAMREAASALALDPKLHGAAELVGRLMLEPPRETPRAVTEAITAEDTATVKALASAGVFASGAGLLAMPLFFWMAPASSSYAIGLSVVLAVSFVVALVGALTGTPRPGLLVIINAVLIMLVARMFSPLFIAPGMAAALAMGTLLTPRFSWLGSATTVAILMIIAVLLPLALEMTGTISSTMSVLRDGVLFRAPGIAGNETPTQIVGVVYTIGIIVAGSAVGGVKRARSRDAHRRLQLQAWQLRELVPR